MSQKVERKKPTPVAAMAMRVSAQRLLRSPGPLLLPSEQTRKDKMDGVSLNSKIEGGQPEKQHGYFGSCIEQLKILMTATTTIMMTVTMSVIGMAVMSVIQM